MSVHPQIGLIENHNERLVKPDVFPIAQIALCISRTIFLFRKPALTKRLFVVPQHLETYGGLAPTEVKGNDYATKRLANDGVQLGEGFPEGCNCSLGKGRRVG